MQASSLEQLGLGGGDFLFLGWHSSLSILACLAWTVGHGKGWLKTEEWGGEGLEYSPVPPYCHPLRWSSACLYLKRKGGRLSLPLPCLWIFLSPGHRGGLLPEQADVAESHAAKLYSSWGENLLWIKACPQSGLVLISLLLCSQTRGVLLITVSAFEGSLQFDQFQEPIIIMIMNFNVHHHLYFVKCLCQYNDFVISIWRFQWCYKCTQVLSYK